MSQPGQVLFGIESSHDGRVVMFAGGIPLKADGQVVGAVGASGGRPDQDHEVAEAGAAAFASAANPAVDVPGSAPACPHRTGWNPCTKQRSCNFFLETTA